MLGLQFDTRRMTVGITKQYRAEVIDLLTKSWHSGRQAFTVDEMSKLIGKLGRIGQAFRPIYHLMPQLYASLAYAFRLNGFYLTAHSSTYRKMLKALGMRATCEEDQREINFAVSTVAKMKHGLKEKYRMPGSLIVEIALLIRILTDWSICLETPIAHIVPRDGTWDGAADSCKVAGGGWSIDLRFWWHLVYPEEVLRRARLPNNKKGKLISINVLEFACVIINFAAAIHVCWLDGLDLSAFPVFLNCCDNTAAVAWINKRCKESMIGRELAKIYVGLLMSTKLGIQADWISTTANKIADEISRIHGGDGEYDYSQLISSYPVLSDCRMFQPSSTLLGMIWDVLLNNVSPDPLTIRNWEPSALGSIISSDS